MMVVKEMLILDNFVNSKIIASVYGVSFFRSGLNDSYLIVPSHETAVGKYIDRQKDTSPEWLAISKKTPKILKHSKWDSN
jgi:hypothetical protein